MRAKMHHDPKSKRKNLSHQDEDHHEVPHVDEKWLVSYSDMMTLLFGLFVMLYSIAMKNKGVAEAVEKELKKISEKGFQSEAVKEMTKNMDEATLKKMVEKLSSDLKIEKLKNKQNVKNQESHFVEAQTLKLQMAQYKKSMDQIKSKDQQRSAASVSSTDSLSKTYFVSVKWENSNHDIDMSVTNPAGQRFDSTNRKFEGNSNEEFVFSSDKGPQASEMYKVVNPKSGEFTFDISMYNSRGDDTDTVAKLYVTLPSGEEVLYASLVVSAINPVDLTKRVTIDFSKLDKISK